jgi:glycerol-3-phosphate cytidylyltransferase
MINVKVGLIAGSFDVIHPGYIYTFRKAKDHCDYLVVALQTDPTIERPNKIKPILSWEERQETLLSIRYIDEVIKYTTELDLINILKTCQYNVRILGDDYMQKYATGQEYSDQIAYIDRDHGWSTTKFKTLLFKSLNGESK